MTTRGNTHGFSLTEMLVALGVVALLTVMAVPSLGRISDSQRRKGAISLAMGTLSSARTLALSGKRESWVVFRQEGGRLFLRTVLGEGPGFSPTGNWLALPAGILPAEVDGSVASLPLPPAVIASAGNPAGEILGGIGFLPTGKPCPGRSGGQLALVMRDARGTKTPAILLSRATGLASLP
jgi:prepilin-type N-terminal cleavage/methylation domain-containing protein